MNRIAVAQELVKIAKSLARKAELAELTPLQFLSMVPGNLAALLDKEFNNVSLLGIRREQRLRDSNGGYVYTFPLCVGRSRSCDYLLMTIDKSGWCWLRVDPGVKKSYPVAAFNPHWPPVGPNEDVTVEELARAYVRESEKVVRTILKEQRQEKSHR